MDAENFFGVFDIILMVLNKLVTNSDFYGGETQQESRIRKLSEAIKFDDFDPYKQFKSLIQVLERNNINLMNNEKYRDQIRRTLSINTCKGQARKLYSITGIK